MTNLFYANRKFQLEVIPMKKNILKVRKYGLIWCLSTELVSGLTNAENENIFQGKDLFNELPLCETSDDEETDSDEDLCDDGDYDVLSGKYEKLNKKYIELNFAKACLSAESFNDR